MEQVRPEPKEAYQLRLNILINSPLAPIIEHGIQREFRFPVCKMCQNTVRTGPILLPIGGRDNHASR